MQAPGLRLRVRRPAVTIARAAARAQEERGSRTHDRLRSGAVHPLPPLRALLSGGSEDGRARGGEPRRRLGDRDVSRHPARQRLLHERRGRLPGGGTHDEGLPLQGPRLVPRRRTGRVHGLFEGLQRAHGRREQSRLPLRAEAQRRGQRHLDVRRRSAHLPRDRRPGSGAGAAGAEHPGRARGGRSSRRHRRGGRAPRAPGGIQGSQCNSGYRFAPCHQRGPLHLPALPRRPRGRGGGRAGGAGRGRRHPRHERARCERRGCTRSRLRRRPFSGGRHPQWRGGSGRDARARRDPPGVPGRHRGPRQARHHRSARLPRIAGREGRPRHPADAGRRGEARYAHQLRGSRATRGARRGAGVGGARRGRGDRETRRGPRSSGLRRRVGCTWGVRRAGVVGAGIRGL